MTAVVILLLGVTVGYFIRPQAQLFLRGMSMGVKQFRQGFEEEIKPAKPARRKRA